MSGKKSSNKHLENWLKNKNSWLEAFANIHVQWTIANDISGHQPKCLLTGCEDTPFHQSAAHSMAVICCFEQNGTELIITLEHMGMTSGSVGWLTVVWSSIQRKFMFDCFTFIWFFSFSSAKLSEHNKHFHLEQTSEGVLCKVCQTLVGSATNAKRHLTAYHKKGQFVCKESPECSSVFITNRELLKHKRTVHRDKIRPVKMCSFEGCGKMIRINSYAQHLDRHYQIRQFKCSWPGCNKEFICNGSLVDHVRIHTNYKRYRCNWPSCDYASEQRTNTIKHIRIRHFNVGLVDVFSRTVVMFCFLVANHPSVGKRKKHHYWPEWTAACWLCACFAQQFCHHKQVGCFEGNPSRRHSSSIQPHK